MGAHVSTPMRLVLGTIAAVTIAFPFAVTITFAWFLINISIP